ncbi:MAG: hypothetical protein PHY18_03690 [Dehalococcoidales bacterium]|nr:hypothetical protein [Dehalococcoidales bacterium]
MMKRYGIFSSLASGAILSCLMTALFVAPSYAADKGTLTLDVDHGEIGDIVEIDGYDFDADTKLNIYFSRDKASVDDRLSSEIASYEMAGLVSVDQRGDFIAPRSFKIPEELNDGRDSEEVWSGTYYFYATYRDDRYIMALVKFTVSSGEIELTPEEGVVGSEVSISGQDMRPGEKITIEYDDIKIDIMSGDSITDSSGEFLCTVIIPESTAGCHNITAADESGNKPGADFTTKPGVTLDKSEQTIDGPVNISGSGFAYRSDITITIDADRIATTPASLHTNHYGSFTGSITIPYYSIYVGGKPSKVTAHDASANSASADLTVLPLPAGITLEPATSLTSPGYVGMELTVTGTHFTPGSSVTITYKGSISTDTTTVYADNLGDFSATLVIPTSAAGIHQVTAVSSDGSISSLFTMESKPPPIPVTLIPQVTNTAPARTRFVWQDVTDTSGVTYLLQIGADSSFSTILLEKEGLTGSEYTLAEKEELEPRGQDTPYYWRVKAIDGAFNESDWTAPGSFYVVPPATPASAWTKYLWIAIGVLVFLLIYRIRRGKIM